MLQQEKRENKPTELTAKDFEKGSQRHPEPAKVADATPRITTATHLSTRTPLFFWKAYLPAISAISATAAVSTSGHRHHHRGRRRNHRRHARYHRRRAQLEGAPGFHQVPAADARPFFRELMARSASSSPCTWTEGETARLSRETVTNQIDA